MSSPDPYLGLSIVIVLIIGVSRSVHANAYLDPGSGSYLLQLLLSALFALIIATKSLWQRAVDVVRKSVGGKQRH